MTRWARRTPFDQVAHRVSIGGSAVDVTTAAPLAGVEVIARSGTRTHRAHTDSRGVFCFEDLPDGLYTITVAHSHRDGHDEKEVTRVESRSQKAASTPLWVEIRLER